MENSMHAPPACKFYLQGRCQRGKHCKYLHSGGRALPLATAIRQPPMVPEFAPGTVTATLEGVKATFGAGVAPISVEFDAADGSTKVESLECSLRVSWRRPRREVKLFYPTGVAADAAVAALDGKEIGGVTLGAKCTLSAERADGDGVGSPWVVTVERVTAAVERGMLREHLVARNAKPASCKWGDLPGTPEEEMEVVRRYVGERTKHTITGEDLIPGKPCFTRADFKLDGAPDLAADMRGIVVAEFGHKKAIFHQHFQLQLSVKKAAFFAIEEGALETLSADIWNCWRIKVQSGLIAPDGRALITLSNAEQREELALAKGRIDALFRKDSGVRSNAGWTSVQSHRIRLSKPSAYQEAKQGFPHLEGAFGRDVVSFDVSDPPAVIVKGDASVLRRVQAYMRGGEASSEPPTCCICFDDDFEGSKGSVKVEGCGHVACKTCVHTYCTMEKEAKFPLRCFGEGCGQALSMRQVQSLLDGEEELKTLLGESLRDHCQRHPGEFAHCPGADCSKSFRISKGEGDARRLCNSCLTAYCARCKVGDHVGMTCAEYQEKLVQDEAETRRWMEENGAKACPGCSAMLQKIEGCNNMECSSCRQSFCWICREIGESHQAVYAHLQRQHGGFFDHEIEARDAMLALIPEEERAINGL